MKLLVEWRAETKWDCVEWWPRVLDHVDEMSITDTDMEEFETDGRWTSAYTRFLTAHGATALSTAHAEYLVFERESDATMFLLRWA